MDARPDCRCICPATRLSHEFLKWLQRNDHFEIGFQAIKILNFGFQTFAMASIVDFSAQFN